MFHLRFGLSDHLKTLLDFVFGSRRRVKKVRIFRAWFSQRCLACICRRSRCRASALTGTREACRVVSEGQNWRLDCNKSLHSAAELVPGRSIDTVSFCGWAPCHAEAALCEYTSCNIPSSRMGNFFVMSSSSLASQSTLAFATKIGLG